MAAAASRDLERSCDEAAVAGRDAAFRRAYGAALLDAVEEGIEARAPLTTHFRGGKAAMKERLLSIASGGTRKKGVALVCAAALVISAGAAACSLGRQGSPASSTVSSTGKTTPCGVWGSMWRPLTRPAALSSRWGI